MFEEIKIREESFDEFYIKHLCLRQRKFLEPKIFRKMMRYLPKRFRTKVIIIGESKDLNTRLMHLLAPYKILNYPYFRLLGTNQWI